MKKLSVLLFLGLGASAFAAPASPALKSRVEGDFPNAGYAPFLHYAVPALGEDPRLPESYPADGAPGAPVSIVVARDEFEPGSFLVMGRRRTYRDVQLTLGAFKNEKGDVFPAEDLDLKVVKVWYQNRNAWFSYYGDTGFKLVPELLLHDESLIRVDEKKGANYARVLSKDGRRHEEWLNLPLGFEESGVMPRANALRFRCMREGFDDAATLQPVTLEENRFKQFFLTAHARRDAKPGLYRGVVKVGDLGEIPVAIRVLDFVLPPPKAYQDPSKDFLVSSYGEVGQEVFLRKNGYDRKLARRQLVSVLKNQVEHNMPMLLVRGNMDPLAFDCIEAMREAGMRTDVFMGAVSPLRDETPEQCAARASIVADEFNRRYGHHNVFCGNHNPPQPPEWFLRERPRLAHYQDAGLRFFLAGDMYVYALGGYCYDWHNAHAGAADPTFAKRWNALQNGSHVAWNINPIVGAENPALNRRQNGLAAYLTGYSALCNYAFALDSYNDASILWRPLVFAYGCGGGILDTLQWEGHREGIDDIRYATLLTDLARQAQKMRDTRPRYAGGKAMQFLALLDVNAYDQDWARAEMIRHIGELLRHVSPSRPESEFKPVSAAERAASAKRLEDGLAKALAEAKRGFATAKNGVETNKVHRKVADVYARYARHEAAGEYLVQNGLVREALSCFRYTPQEGRVDALRRQMLTDGTKPGYDPQTAFWQLLEDSPAPDKEVLAAFEPAFFGKLRPTDTNGWRRAVGGVFGELGRRRLVCRDKFAAFTAVFEKTLPIARRWGVAVPAEVAFDVFAAYLAQHDARRAVESAKLGLKDEKAKPEARYRLNLAIALGSRPRQKPADALAAIRKVDAANAGDLPAKARDRAVRIVGAFLPSEGYEDAIRALDEFRRSLLVAPSPKKRYVVAFSDRPIDGVGDWRRVVAEATAFDRRYVGGRLAFRDAPGDAKKAAMPDPAMKVVADVNGIHVFVVAKDPEAKAVDLGRTGLGSLEFYIAPGADEPYVCVLPDLDRGTVEAFSTTYDTFGRRRLAGAAVARDCRLERRVEGENVVAYLFLSWRTWSQKVPKDGSVWDFESLFWHRLDSFAWNGTESLHGRSTWGELEFRLTDAQRRAVLKPLLARAYAHFRGERQCGRKDGVFAHWKDDAVGDPAFYDAELKALEKTLADYGQLMQADMSGSTIDFLARVVLPQWEDVAFEVQRRRARWLERELTK